MLHARVVITMSALIMGFAGCSGSEFSPSSSNSANEQQVPAQEKNAAQMDRQALPQSDSDAQKAENEPVKERTEAPAVLRRRLVSSTQERPESNDPSIPRGTPPPASPGNKDQVHLEAYKFPYTGNNDKPVCSSEDDHCYFPLTETDPLFSFMNQSNYYYAANLHVMKGAPILEPVAVGSKYDDPTVGYAKDYSELYYKWEMTVDGKPIPSLKTMDQIVNPKVITEDIFLMDSTDDMKSHLVYPGTQYIMVNKAAMGKSFKNVVVTVTSALGEKQTITFDKLSTASLPPEDCQIPSETYVTMTPTTILPEHLQYKKSLIWKADIDYSTVFSIPSGSGKEGPGAWFNKSSGPISTHGFDYSMAQDTTIDLGIPGAEITGVVLTPFKNEDIIGVFPDKAVPMSGNQFTWPAYSTVTTPKMPGYSVINTKPNYTFGATVYCEGLSYTMEDEAVVNFTLPTCSKSKQIIIRRSMPFPTCYSSSTSVKSVHASICFGFVNDQSQFKIELAGKDGTVFATAQSGWNYAKPYINKCAELDFPLTNKSVQAPIMKDVRVNLVLNDEPWSWDDMVVKSMKVDFDASYSHFRSEYPGITVEDVESITVPMVPTALYPVPNKVFNFPLKN